MKKVEVAILAACFLVVAYQPAEAVDIEIGTGYSYGITQPDGAGYYQETLPHWIDTDDQSLSLGVSWQPGRLRYRAEFLTLGKQSVNAVITADHHYNPRNVVNCDRPCREFSITGNGSVSGAVFSASRHVGSSPFYVEAGVYAHTTKWQAKVSDFDGNVLDERERLPSIDFGPVVGIGIRYEGIDFGVRYVYLDDSAEGDPMTPMLAGVYLATLKAYF